MSSPIAARRCIVSRRLRPASTSRRVRSVATKVAFPEELLASAQILTMRPPPLECTRRSDLHGRNFYTRSAAFDDYDAAFGDVIELAVALEVVTDLCALRNANVLVEDGVAHLGVAADIAVVEDDAVFNDATC